MYDRSEKISRNMSHLTSHMLVITLTVLLSDIDNPIFAEHGKAYELNLSKMEENISEVLVYDLDEQRDPINKMKYSLFISYNASANVSVYVCNCELLSQCLQWTNILVLRRQKESKIISSYISRFPDMRRLYVHISSPEDAKIKLQIQTSVPYSSNLLAQIMPDQSLFMTMTLCSHWSRTLYFDGHLMCVSSKAHPKGSYENRSECDLGLFSSSPMIPLNFYELYTFVALLSNGTYHRARLERLELIPWLDVNKENSIKVYSHQLCAEVYQCSAKGDVAVITEIKNSTQRLDFVNAIYNQNNELLSDLTAPIQVFHSESGFKYTVSSSQHQIAMPWDTKFGPMEPLAPQEMIVIFSTNLALLEEDTDTATNKQFAYNNYADSGPHSSKYELAMVMTGEVTHTASFSEKLGQIGDSCSIDETKLCQLLVPAENNTRKVKLSPNRMVYVTSHIDDVIRMSKVFIIQPDQIYSDKTKQNKARYYKIVTDNVTSSSRLFVTSAQEKNLTVTISVLHILPQPDQINVSTFTGVNLSIQFEAEFNCFGCLVFVRVFSEVTTEISIKFVHKDIQNIQFGDEPIKITTITGQKVNIAYNVPPPLKSNNNIVLYEYVTLLARIVPKKNCTVTISSGQSLKIQLNTELSLGSISVVPDSDIIVFTVHSECDIDVNVAAAPVYPFIGETTVKHMNKKITFTTSASYKIKTAQVRAEKFSFRFCEQPDLLEDLNCTLYSGSGQLRVTTDQKVGLWYLSVEVQSGDYLTVSANDLTEIEPFSRHYISVHHQVTEYFTLSRRNVNISLLLVDAELDSAKICLTHQFDRPPFDCFDISGHKEYTLPEDCRDVTVYLTTNNDVVGSASFTLSLFQPLVNGTTFQNFRKNEVRQFTFSKLNAENDLLVSAVERIADYPEVIPDSMHRKTIEMYVNKKKFASSTNYLLGQTQIGPQAVVIKSYETVEKRFYIAIKSNYNAIIEISAVENVDITSVSTGDSTHFEKDSNITSTIVLNSAISSSEVSIELCKGRITDIAMSYYHVPTLSGDFFSRMVINQIKSGMYQAILNSSNGKQNFFASITSEGKSNYVIRHSLSNIPEVSDSQIWVVESNNNGILTVQVSDAQYFHALKYQAFFVTDTINSTSCGVIGGIPVSDPVTPSNQTSGITKLTTNVPLKTGRNATMNVVAFYGLNGGIAVAYKPIFVWNGMNPTLILSNKSNINTVLWVLVGVYAAIILGVGTCLIILYRKHRKGYQQLPKQVEQYE